MASEDFECSAYIVKYRCIILFLRYFDGAGSSNFYYYNFYYLIIYFYYKSDLVFFKNHLLFS